MIVCIKNYFRNEMCNLTIKSIRHFYPDTEIHVVCLYKDSVAEYDAQPALEVDADKVYYRQSKYHGPRSKNNVWFSEGYNIAFDMFKSLDDKFLLLCEDHFFTTGATLKAIHETDFIFAAAPWNTGYNGSILAMVPSKVAHAFPIPEREQEVEAVFNDQFKSKLGEAHIWSLGNYRHEADYKGDGMYTNDVNEIRAKLVEAGIVS